MAEVLALQDLEPDGPDSATPRTGPCCFSNWASLSDLTIEDMVQ
jgi:hypothetical protein